MIAATRRRLLLGAASCGLTFASPRVRAQAKARIVIVGGGIGGVTVARYLLTGTDAVDITLIEPKTRYTTSIFSNLYLAGMRSFESLTYGYEALAALRGIELVCDTAVLVDPVARRVHLASGATLPFDRAVVSPGISFVPKALDGYGAAAMDEMPHAWMPGAQGKLLRAQLEAMADGGLFIIVVSPEPISCPLAPYERASLAGYYLKQFKPRSKVLILDGKESFPAQDVFRDGWNRHYPGLIEWLPATLMGGGVIAVDTATRAVKTATHSFKGDVVNVIPPQRAGDIAQSSGLTDATGWCPIDPVTFESTRHAAIHVIGDAADAGEMSKSAFSANSQAKACAFAISAALAGTPYPSPHLLDASFSFLAGDDAVSFATAFEPMRNSIKATETAASHVGEPKERRRQTVQEAHGWYDAFMRDVFG